MKIEYTEGENYNIKINTEILKTKEAIEYLIKKVEILDVTTTESTVDEMVINLYKEYGV